MKPLLILIGTIALLCHAMEWAIGHVGNGEFFAVVALFLAIVGSGCKAS